MRRLHQIDWHGIPFDSFARLTATRRATPAFYSAFYRELFSRLHGPQGLEPEWVRYKQLSADLILAAIPDPPLGKVLSVGCGLGIVEGELKRRRPALDLEVTEVAPEPLRWLPKTIPSDGVHLGYAPECLPPDSTYDLIYLVAMDYLFKPGEWSSLLSLLRLRLAPGGSCLSVQGGIDAQNRPPTQRLKEWVRDRLDFIFETIGGGAPGPLWDGLGRLGYHHRGQWWGYQYTKGEALQTVRDAGFSKLETGCVETGTRWGELHWIRGYR